MRKEPYGTCGSGLMLVWLSILSACSAPDENRISEVRIPLAKLVGDKITFEMCGQKISLRRSSVVAMRTNNGEGLVNDSIHSVSAFLNPSDLNDWAGSPGKGAVNFSCGKATANEYSYGPHKRNFIKKSELPDLGLELLEANTSRDSSHFHGFYRSLSVVQNDVPFEMQCYANHPDAVPFNCEIRGVSNYRFQLFMSISSPGVFKNWRQFKNYYETFITIEGNK